MANPAELLLQILNEWRATNSTPPTSRHRIAVRHLDAIDALLSEMEAAGHETELFRKYFEKWCSLTLHTPHEWQRQSNLQHVDNTALEHLQHLASQLRQVSPTLKPGGLDEVRAMAASAKALVDDETTGLDPVLRQHVLQVIAHLNWCIDNYEAVGDFDLQEAVERLVATMLRTAATIKDDETVSKWRQWMDGFVYPFAVNVASAIPGSALVQLALGH